MICALLQLATVREDRREIASINIIKKFLTKKIIYSILNGYELQVPKWKKNRIIFE
jgi:hypothetical protein